jgi:Cdc6-like AAA superfamily ATPase
LVNYIAMIFDNLEPHCAMIVGRRGSGKTHYALDLLEHEFYQKFNRIVIVSPTFDFDKTCNRKWLEKVHKINPTKQNLNEIIEKVANKFKDKNSHTLILLDDCAFDENIGRKRPALTELAFTSRHYGISIWITAQKYNSINKSFREQLSWLAIFYCKDKDSFKEALDENNAVELEKRNAIHNELKSSCHKKLIIRNDFPVMYMIE